MQEFTGKEQIEGRKSRKIVTQIMSYFKLNDVDKIKIQYDGKSDDILFMILLKEKNIIIIEHPTEKSSDNQVIWFDARIQRPGYLLSITNWGKNALYECTFYSGKFYIEAKKNIFNDVIKVADWVADNVEKKKIGKLLRVARNNFTGNHIIRFSTTYRE